MVEKRLTDAAVAYLLGVRDRGVQAALDEMGHVLSGQEVARLRKVVTGGGWLSFYNPSKLSIRGEKVSFSIAVDLEGAEVVTRARLCTLAGTAVSGPLDEVRGDVRHFAEFLGAVSSIEGIYADGAETLRSMHEDGQVWVAQRSLSGTVTSYERSRGRAVADLGDETVEFSSTCFYGARGQVHPCVGDRVRVFFEEGDETSVLAVIADSEETLGGEST